MTAPLSDQQGLRREAHHGIAGYRFARERGINTRANRAGDPRDQRHQGRDLNFG
jgi:hypothetical protein